MPFFVVAIIFCASQQNLIVNYSFESGRMMFTDTHPRIDKDFSKVNFHMMHELQDNHSTCASHGLQDTCTCETYCDKWVAPSPYRRPTCFFIDLGVEIAQSALAFIGENNSQACRYALKTSEVFSQKWFDKHVCPKQTDVARKMFEDKTWPSLGKAGFERNQCIITLVEPSRHFGQVFHALHIDYPDTLVHNPRAIYQCDSTRLVFDDDPHHRSSFKSSRAQLGIKTLNLNRLLWVTAREDDHVILKVDVEGGEYDLLACLAKSPSLNLVDQLLLERHDRLVSHKDIIKLNNALSIFRKKGIHVSENWP